MRWVAPQTTYCLTSDTTPLLKPHAPTLEEQPSEGDNLMM
jgi:hypothetical protein